MTHTFRIKDHEGSRLDARHAILSAPDGYVAKFERKIILTEKTRGNALDLVRKLAGFTLKLVRRNRTQEQNDKMWAMLTDLSIQKPEGRKCTPDDWKCLVMNACNHDCMFMEGLDGKPFPVGFRSSRLNTKEMSEIINWMYGYGLEQGIVWSEPEPQHNNTMEKAG